MGLRTSRIADRRSDADKAVYSLRNTLVLPELKGETLRPEKLSEAEGKELRGFIKRKRAHGDSGSSRSTRRKNGASRSSPARRLGTSACSRVSTRSARRRRRSQPQKRSYGSRHSRGVSSTQSPARSHFPASL